MKKLTSICDVEMAVALRFSGGPEGAARQITCDGLKLQIILYVTLPFTKKSKQFEKKVYSFLSSKYFGSHKIPPDIQPPKNNTLLIRQTPTVYQKVDR